MSIRMLGLAIVTAALLPELAAAQAPPATKAPPPPAAAKPSQAGDCAPNAPATTNGKAGDVDVAKPDGSNLSQKLAESNGVLCPPEQGDRAIETPPPATGRTPVIKPPGTPGSPDQSVQPK
ncbi:MAG: hypothetical protein ACTHLO_06110 [Pseudolabrys sp.]